MVAAMSQGAQAQASSGAPNGPMMAATVNSYINVFSKQLDKALIFAGLEPNGLHLSALVSFQSEALLAKVFAAAKPSGKPLLAGLPAGDYIVAAASETTNQDFAQPLMDMFYKPYLDAMRASGNPAMAARADLTAKLGTVRVQLAKLQRSSQTGRLQPAQGLRRHPRHRRDRPVLRGPQGLRPHQAEHQESGRLRRR